VLAAGAPAPAMSGLGRVNVHRPGLQRVLGEGFEWLGGAESKWRGNLTWRRQWRGGGQLRAVEQRARARMEWGVLLKGSHLLCGARGRVRGVRTRMRVRREVACGRHGRGPVRRGGKGGMRRAGFKAP
jgi:hypothetical protein